MSVRAHPLAHVSEVELALLDVDGVIVAVNDAWVGFCVDNGGDVARAGVGMSYLEICDRADDVGSREVGASIRAALAGELPAPAVVTVPCDGPGVPRLFDVLVSSRLDDQGNCVGATVTLSQKEDRNHKPAPIDPWLVPPVDRDAADGARYPVEPPTRVEDRERIAAHLNSVVMRDLLEIGMGLQGMREGLPRPEDRTRLAHYVEALDGIIHDIRTTVFELTPVADEPIGLKHRLLEVVDGSGLNALGTSVEFTGPLDSDLSADVGDLVVEVLRGALADAVEHSGASMVNVSVGLSGPLITVQVSDDGSANRGATLGAALRRLKRYAEPYRGDLEVTTGPGGGTMLRWTALLEPDRRRSAAFAPRR